MQLRTDGTGSSWDKVNLLQSSQNGACFVALGLTQGLMFYLLLSSVCTAPKFFSFSHSGLPASREAGKRHNQGRWPKGYSMP